MVLLPQKVITALRQLFPDESHGTIFLVGGTVRDALLEKSQQDIDLLVSLPEKMLRCCGFRKIAGKTTAPIWFRSHPELGTIEATQMADPALLEQELTRRDFTINAMAASLAGQLYDPLDGRSDLLQRRLAVCSTSCFNDDPLRIFRALRFEADGWRLTAESEASLVSRDWACQLAGIPVERFSRELLKALSTEQPTRFFERMFELKLGQHWLPELFAMAQVPAGPPNYHPEGNLLIHSLQVLQRSTQASTDPLVRFCGLFHDLGKLQTNPAEYPRHHGHDEAGVAPAIELCTRLRLPSRFRTALAGTNRLHTRMNNWDKLRDATKLRLATQASKAGISSILPLVSQADKQACLPPQDWELVLQIAALPAASLGITASRLEALSPEERSGLVFNGQVQALRLARGNLP